jgi:pantetheine-phosphate adenylyltransferase
MANRIGVYPGSFDPATKGHVDLMERAARMFDTVFIAVANNAEKKCLFSYEERVDMIQQLTTHIPNIEVRTFQGLIVDLVRELDAIALIRGIRAVSDFEYEMSMAVTNRRLLPSCDTISFMPSEKHMFVSSRLVKEIVHLGGDATSFVPDLVLTRLKEKLND